MPSDVNHEYERQQGQQHQKPVNTRFGANTLSLSHRVGSSPQSLINFRAQSMDANVSYIANR